MSDTKFRWTVIILLSAILAMVAGVSSTLPIVKELPCKVQYGSGGTKITDTGVTQHPRGWWYDQSWYQTRTVERASYWDVSDSRGVWPECICVIRSHSELYIDGNWEDLSSLVRAAQFARQDCSDRGASRGLCDLGPRPAKYRFTDRACPDWASRF